MVSSIVPERTSCETFREIVEIAGIQSLQTVPLSCAKPRCSHSSDSSNACTREAGEGQKGTTTNVHRPGFKRRRRPSAFPPCTQIADALRGFFHCLSPVVSASTETHEIVKGGAIVLC
jgi:hypothetical protein